MKYVKEYGLLLAKFLGFLLGGSFLISVLYYFLISSKVVQILSMIYLVLLFFIFGFRAGKKAEAKGFLAGIKVGTLFLVCLFLFHLIVNRFHFAWITILFYLVLLLASVLGATLGINTKKE